jgi:multiple sugar transport system permease protein
MTEPVMTVQAIHPPAPAGAKRNRRRTLNRAGLHGFLIVISALWLFPLVFAVYTSFRTYADTSTNGYLSITQSLTLVNYQRAWDQSEMARYFLNTVVILVPAVIGVLFLASMMAFAVSRYSWRFNLVFLLLFTAANLLPPQVVITPLFRLFLRLPLPPGLSDSGNFYNQYFGVMMIHIAFQLGFCTFVLSNYMKTLPKELNEAAIVDGASVWRTFRSVILPLTRPALAALAVLQVTFIYNDFFWALLLMSSGSKFPITSALNNLKGQFFEDNNLIAAGALLVALPTIVVFLFLQRHFVSGLTLGSTKG